MEAYTKRSRSALGLSSEEWDTLSEFLTEAQSVIQQTKRETGVDIEAQAPRIVQSSEPPGDRFAPGGWVGQYPGDVYVYPSKLTETEYEQMLEDIAGWIEVWDLPTASAALPVYESSANDERTIMLGYSEALRAFTEEVLAQRPAVNVQRTTESGYRPRGAIDFQRTVTAQASGRNEIVYNRLQFSFEHPLNRLLIRFHAELESVLMTLSSESYLVEAALKDHAQYHRDFLESEFSDELVQESVEQTLPALIENSRERRDAPGQMTELIRLTESYLQRRALGINFQQQLTVGLKPVSKLYELWVLTQLLARLEELTGEESSRIESRLSKIAIGPDCTLHYNRTLRDHSRLLAEGLGSHPGRPDYALEFDGEIVWIGDAKYSPVRNIGLQSYQRLLSYAADLLPTDGPATASVLHVDSEATQKCVSSTDYNILEICVRPGDIPANLIPPDVVTVLRG